MLWGDRGERSSLAEVHAARMCSSLLLLQAEFLRCKPSGSCLGLPLLFLWDELGSLCSRKTLGCVRLGARGTGTASPGKPSLLPPWELLGSLAALWALNSPLNSPQTAD